MTPGPMASIKAIMWIKDEPSSAINGDKTFERYLFGFSYPDSRQRTYEQMPSTTYSSAYCLLFVALTLATECDGRGVDAKVSRSHTAW